MTWKVLCDESQHVTARYTALEQRRSTSRDLPHVAARYSTLRHVTAWRRTCQKGNSQPIPTVRCSAPSAASIGMSVSPDSTYGVNGMDH